MTVSMTLAETCSRDDCTTQGEMTRGMCRKHYERWRRTASPVDKPSGLPPIRRLIRFIQVDVSSCWSWTAQLNREGYGTFTFGGRPRRAHRVAYELFVGPIPDGLHLDHLCRNRRCVRPDHLEPVTPAENNRRSTSRSALNALKTTCPEGHPYDFTRATGQRGCRQCNNSAERAKYDRSPRLRSRAEMTHCLTVPCSTCNAEVDEWCRRPGGVASFLHAARFRASADAS